MLTLLAVALANEPPASDLPLPHEVIEGGRTLRNVGRIVSAPGIALGGLGVGMLATGGVLALTRCQCRLAGDLQLNAPGPMVLAAPFLAVGIPMWATGRHRMSKHRGQPPLWLPALDGGPGVTVSGRF